MRKLTHFLTTLLFLLASVSHSFATNTSLTTCPGDVFLFSQNDVNNYNGCSEIEGMLFISGADITDLRPLGNLMAVGTDVFVTGCNQLTDFTGLRRLNTIGGSLTVVSNNSFESFNGLDNLQNVQSIAAYFNPSMTSTRGIPFVQSVYNLELVGNNLLEELDLDLNLVEGDLTIIDNDVLSTLRGLEELGKIGGCLSLSDNDMLSDLSALSNLTTIENCLSINLNPELRLIAMNNLAFLGGQLFIENNATLRQIHFESISSLSALWIQLNGDLNVLELPLLRSIDGQLYVVNNSILAECCALFPALASGDVGGSITIQNNSPNCNSDAEITTYCPSFFCADAPEGQWVDMREPQAVRFHWEPVLLTTACNVELNTLRTGQQRFYNVTAWEASQLGLPNSLFRIGWLYYWRVRCTCEQNPLVETPWSRYQLFRYVPGTIRTLVAEEDDTAFIDNHFQNSLGFNVYPNPTPGPLYVNLSEVEQLTPVQLQVYDVNGALVRVIDDAVPGQTAQVDVADLPAGVYVLQVVLEGEVRSRKFVVE